MPSIPATNDMSILKIDKFLGLNENPDGDTTLRVGEMSQMRNFRITQDGHLQIRPGCRTLLDLREIFPSGEEANGEADETRCFGVWRGSVGERETVLTAYDGGVYELDIENRTAVCRGTSAKAETCFFGFGGKVYLLNGEEYLSWDGRDDTEFVPVEGYIPTVQTATTPEGDGTLLENVNRLTGKKRVRYSPDGKTPVFSLPEKEVDEVVSVELAGSDLPGYTVNTVEGTVEFDSAPAAGTNTLTVTYRKGEGAREQVLKMRFCELFNGSTDTRVFLYGDGSNKTIYSGVEYETGQPSAEYFPDLFEAAVGESNAPITSMVRHYSRVMIYKPDSTYIMQYSTLTLEDGKTTAAFYVQPVNRILGNEAMGQVKLLENNPLSIEHGGIYSWRSTSTSGYVTSTENNAKRISDRVAQSSKELSPDRVKTFNLKGQHEYWFLQDGTALILNYSNDCWYLYEGLPYAYLLEADREVYGFCHDGRVMRISRDYRSDDGVNLNCYAATGAMDFGRSWELKYIPMIFMTLQPETGARVTVTAESDRRSDYPEKELSYSLATFSNVDFRHFSFNTSRRPKTRRVKLKVKKATYYKLVFKSDSSNATATILEADVRLRYAGTVK